MHRNEARLYIMNSITDVCQIPECLEHLLLNHLWAAGRSLDDCIDYSMENSQIVFHI